MTRGTATEFVIRQEDGQTLALVQTNDENLRVGDPVLILRGDRVRLTADRSQR